MCMDLWNISVRMDNFTQASPSGSTLLVGNKATNLDNLWAIHSQLLLQVLVRGAEIGL